MNTQFSICERLRFFLLVGCGLMASIGGCTDGANRYRLADATEAVVKSISQKHGSFLQVDIRTAGANGPEQRLVLVPDPYGGYQYRNGEEWERDFHTKLLGVLQDNINYKVRLRLDSRMRISAVEELRGQFRIVDAEDIRRAAVGESSVEQPIAADAGRAAEAAASAEHNDVGSIAPDNTAKEPSYSAYGARTQSALFAECAAAFSVVSSILQDDPEQHSAARQLARISLRTATRYAEQSGTDQESVFALVEEFHRVYISDAVSARSDRLLPRKQECERLLMSDQVALQVMRER